MHREKFNPSFMMPSVAGLLYDAERCRNSSVPSSARGVPANHFLEAFGLRVEEFAVGNVLLVIPLRYTNNCDTRFDVPAKLIVVFKRLINYIRTSAIMPSKINASFRAEATKKIPSPTFYTCDVRSPLRTRMVAFPD